MEKSVAKNVAKSVDKSVHKSVEKVNYFYFLVFFSNLLRIYTLNHSQSINSLWYGSLSLSPSPCAHLVFLRRDHISKHHRSQIRRHIRSEMAELSASSKSVFEADLLEALSWAIS